MTTIELHLDKETIERARRIAASRAWTMEELFAVGLDMLENGQTQRIPLLGLFSEDAELMDQIAEEAMQARERDTFRWNDGEILT